MTTDPYRRTSRVVSYLREQRGDICITLIFKEGLRIQQVKINGNREGAQGRECNQDKIDLDIYCVQSIRCFLTQALRWDALTIVAYIRQLVNLYLDGGEGYQWYLPQNAAAGKEERTGGKEPTEHKRNNKDKSVTLAKEIKS